MSYTFDTSFVQYAVHHDTILEATYKDDVPRITKEIAEEIVEERLAFQSGKRYLLLLHGESRIKLSKEATNFFGSPSGTEGISAAAILIDSWGVYATIRILMKFKRPDLPMAVFRSREKAKNWLLSFRTGTAEESIHSDAMTIDQYPPTIQPDLSNDNLSLSRQYLDHLLNHSLDMIVIISRKGIIVDINNAACKRLGYDKEHLIGCPFASVTKGESSFYDASDIPIPVYLHISMFPKGFDGQRETLVIAREMSLDQVPSWIDSAIEPNQYLDEEASKGIEVTHTRFSANPAIRNYSLTKRELAIIEYISQGYNNADIGSKIGTSHKVIEFQKDLLFEKLDVRNSAALIQRANDLDLIGKNAY